MMRKSVILATVVFLALAGCGKSETDKADTEVSTDYSAAEAPTEQAAVSDGGEQPKPTAPNSKYSGFPDQSLTALLDTIVTCTYAAERLDMITPEHGFDQKTMTAATLAKSVIQKQSDLAGPLSQEIKSRPNSKTIVSEAYARTERHMAIMKSDDYDAKGALFSEWADMMSSECN